MAGSSENAKIVDLIITLLRVAKGMKHLPMKFFSFLRLVDSLMDHVLNLIRKYHSEDFPLCFVFPK